MRGPGHCISVGTAVTGSHININALNQGINCFVPLQHHNVAQFQDGTIGDDIVVKPLSAHVRQVLNTQRMSAEESEAKDGGGGGILADYVRSLQDVEGHRPRQEAEEKPRCPVNMKRAFYVSKSAIQIESSERPKRTFYRTILQWKLDFRPKLFGFQCFGRLVLVPKEPKWPEEPKYRNRNIIQSHTDWETEVEVPFRLWLGLTLFERVNNAIKNYAEYVA